MWLKQKYQQTKPSGHLPAVSLVETIIAMVIITLSFAGGMLLFMNVLRNEQLPLRTEASVALQNQLIQTKQEHRYLDETLTEKGFQILKKVTNYGSNAETFQVHLLARDHQGVVLHELKEVIYLPSKKKK